MILLVQAGTAVFPRNRYFLNNGKNRTRMIEAIFKGKKRCFFKAVVHFVSLTLIRATFSASLFLFFSSFHLYPLKYSGKI
jgi:hypothetical protein